jgi:acetylornithine deacetylase
MLGDLVGTPSVSSTSSGLDQGNLPVISLLANWLEPLGFSCEIMPIPGQPNKANLIATLGKGPGGLVLSGHTDTVPFDDKGWLTDPLTATSKDNRLYGLGTTDMKGFFAIAIEALQPFLEMELKAPLIILATADEESTMSGALELVAQGRPQARYAVIGEPTGMVPIHKHKSITMQRIAVEGRSGHSSNPELGNSALEAMHEVIARLLAYRDQLQTEFYDPAFAVATPTINLGCIHGGDNPNRICPSCELHFDARLLPGMHNQTLVKDVQGIVNEVAAKRQLSIQLSPLFDGVEPFSQALDSELVRAAEQLTGHQAETVAFATEGPYLQQMGIDTVILGPGDIDTAHQPNEFLPLDSIQPMTAILRSLIEKFCL